MARKLLSLCRFGDEYQALKVEAQGGNLAVAEAVLAVTPENLADLCGWADEIFFAGTFPTALYLWDELPKVGKKHLPALIRKSVQAKVGNTVALVPEFYSKTPLEENDRDRVPIIALPQDELQLIWRELDPFKHKIKCIVPIHTSLAKLAAAITNFTHSFMVVWISAQITEIVVVSPEGLVKIARSVPIGLAEGDDRDAFKAERFMVDLAREISVTQTFYRQEFRQASPNDLLLFAGATVINSLELFPLNVVGLTVTMPEKSLFTELPPEQLGPLSHLLGVFQVAEDFRFLPPELAASRRVKIFYKLAYGALAIALIGVSFWLVFALKEQHRLENKYQQSLSNYDQSLKRVVALQRDVKSLRPLQGWEKYYNEVYRQRPRWNRLISELALKVTDDIIIGELVVEPNRNGGARRRNRQSLNTSAWHATLKGRVKASDWQSGLDYLRSFGSDLEASPIFSIQQLSYVPKKLSAPGARTFSFNLKLKVKTEAELEQHEN